MSDFIDAHLRHLRAIGTADTTIAYRRKLLHRLDRTLPMGLDRCTVEELEDFLATPAFLPQSRGTYYTHIVGYFRWACDPQRLHLDYDPSAGLKRPRVPAGIPHPVSNAELAHILANLGEPYRTWAAIAAYEGARAGEVAAILRSDITEQRTRIVFGKGGKTRDLKTHIEVWRAVRHFPAGRIARGVRHGREVDSDYVSSTMIRQFKRIGLPDVTIHRLRHWYGTMMLRPKEFGGAGASLRAVQENMGHASLATTARYTLVCDEERDAAIDALPAFATPTHS